MVGVKTALNDNPKLSTRLWKGKNPLALVIDPNQKLSRSKRDYNLFKRKFITIINQNHQENGEQIQITVEEILDQLYDRNLQSVIIEGGGKTLQSFIDADLWDEARIFKTKQKISDGLKGPKIKKDWVNVCSKIKEDTLITIYKN